MTRNTRIMLSEAIDLWLQYMESRGEDEFAPNTIYSRQQVITRFLRASGDKQLMSVTPDHVEKYFYGPGGLRHSHQVGTAWTYIKQNEGIATSTHNQYRAVFMAFFAWCEERDLCRVRVMKNVRRIKERKQHKFRPAPHIVLSLLDYAKNPRDRIYLAVTMNTALRESEAIPIKIGDVDLEGRYLRV